MSKLIVRWNPHHLVWTVDHYTCDHHAGYQQWADAIRAADSHICHGPFVPTRAWLLPTPGAEPIEITCRIIPETGEPL